MKNYEYKKVLISGGKAVEKRSWMVRGKGILVVFITMLMISTVFGGATDISIGEKKIDKTGIDAWSDATGLMTEIALKEIDDSDFISELDDQRSYRYTFVDPVSGLGQYGDGGTIYIRADGSIDPPTANITSADNITYYFTDNIYDSIVVERDNIVIDGAGYTLQGTGSGYGISLSGRSNVTIKNMEIKSFNDGISLSSSSNNTISGNNITANSDHGTELSYSSSNTISGNNIKNNGLGIWLGYYSSSNAISGNNIIANNGHGLWIVSSPSNAISGNNIKNNDIGFYLHESPSSALFHNNFVNNSVQFYIYASVSVWDDGYPSGGNYWSDYNGVDIYSGPYQNETRKDGIGDTPYIVNAENQDRYPLMSPWGLPSTIYVPTRYPTIQAAINVANPGDTIFVYSGTYYENVVVNKTLTLIGENRATTIIDGSNTGTVVNVTSSNVSISGFTIQHSGPLWQDSGIYLGSVSNCNISGNTITNNSYDGIELDGICDYNTISGNNITNNGDGIYFDKFSSNNSISGNNITNNSYDGIYLDGICDYNTISGNNITNNNDGIYLYWSRRNSISGNNITANNRNGIWLFMYSHYNTISGNNITANNQDGIELGSVCHYNTISGNNITNNNWDGINLWGGSSRNTVSGNNITANNRNGIWLDSGYNTISGNNITANNDYGIYLSSDSWYNSIVRNSITANNDGVYLYESSFNTISGNNITNNSGSGIILDSYPPPYPSWTFNNTISGNSIINNHYGIYAKYSSNNNIYHNNFVDNTEQVYSYDSTNVWDNSYPSGGNYWSDFDEPGEGAYDDYHGPNQDEFGSDGIVDNGSVAGGGLNPYNISGGNNQDNYPLINPFIRGDCNGDGIIDIGDVVYLINYLFRGGSVPKPPSAGDVNCDGI